MKIAVYYNLNFGGAKRVVYEHVKGLRELGNTVDVYTIDKAHDIFDPGAPADNEYRYVFDPKKVSIPILSRIKHDFDTFVTLRNLHKKIAFDIDTRKYDIVLVHTDTLTQSPYVLFFLKTRNVYFCLEPLRMVYEYSLRVQEDLSLFNKIYENINRLIRRKVDRENARSAKVITAISYFAREYIILAYDLYPKISYLGVDIDLFRPIVVKKKKQVLFVAEKQSIYGYDLLISAINCIPKELRPDVKILSWTNNPSERLSDEEVVKLYSESSVTIALSKFDTFGLIPLESMACETPVIALRVAGYRETVLDGETGYLVDFDPHEIAEKIIHMFEHTEKSKLMGKKGRQWVEKEWTWRRQIKNLNDLLQQVS